jgi:predicted lactoylglutathione lyase
MITTLAFVVLPVKDIQTARRFYEDILMLASGGLNRNFVANFVDPGSRRNDR